MSTNCLQIKFLWFSFCVCTLALVLWMKGNTMAFRQRGKIQCWNWHWNWQAPFPILASMKGLPAVFSATVNSGKQSRSLLICGNTMNVQNAWENPTTLALQVLLLDNMCMSADSRMPVLSQLQGHHCFHRAAILWGRSHLIETLESFFRVMLLNWGEMVFLLMQYFGCTVMLISSLTWQTCIYFLFVISLCDWSSTLAMILAIFRKPLLCWLHDCTFSSKRIAL